MTVVQYERYEEIAQLTLNRPDRLNAVTDELVNELVECLEIAEAESVRAVVIKGSGRAFCAGHDLYEHRSTDDNLVLRRRLQKIQDVTRWIRRLDAPVISAVHGYALGAGCEFALAADLVIAADSSIFGFPEVGVGLSVTGGITQTLPLAVGNARAKQLILTGERVQAKRALDWGLINRMVPEKDLTSAAIAWARDLSCKPALAMSLAKHSLDSVSESVMQTALSDEVLSARIAMNSSESQFAATEFRRSGDEEVTA